MFLLRCSLGARAQWPRVFQRSEELTDCAVVQFWPRCLTQFSCSYPSARSQWEAVRRFNAPTDVAARTVIWVSLLGIGINTATALMFVSGRKGDLNIRGAFLHMVSDAGISAGVVIA